MSRLRPVLASAAAALSLLGMPLGAASAASGPSHSVAPRPDYPDLCAPAGLDTSAICLRLTLAAIDGARAGEGLPPARVPATFSALSVAEQVFVAVDVERVDRGLPPFVGLTAALDRDAQRGAARGALPSRPGPNTVRFRA